MLDQMLRQADYPAIKREFLIDGFTNGFSIKYKGPTKVRRFAPNRPFNVGTPTDLWNKVMKEVEAGHYAGPYRDPPFDYFIQSPVGLVPKDHGTKTRLIFHLSYPKKGESVNAGISKEDCSVQYPSFDAAVRLCIQEGKSCHLSRSDVSRAFRNAPLDKYSWRYLLLKARHPVTGDTYFFTDKCVPFGSSISCAIFQAISDGVAHIVKYRTGKDNVNYLDDYLFAALLKLWCDWQVDEFIQVCNLIGLPVAMEKTFWGSTQIVFLGLLIDTIRQVICIPTDKIDKAKNLLSFYMDKAHKKTTIARLQSLVGYLNFLCKCVIPGRAFTRRLYAYLSPKLKPHYHIKITDEIRQDLTAWWTFINNSQVYCRPFMDFITLQATEKNMYSDAS